MGLSQLLILGGLTLIYRLILGSRGREWVLFIASILAVFWLQPALPVRGLDFWLPTATLGLCLFGWLLTQPSEGHNEKENRIAILLIAGVVLLLALTRYANLPPLLTASRPPALPQALIGMSVAGVSLLLLRSWARLHPHRLSATLTAGLGMMILLFILLKAPALTQTVSAILRGWSGQAVERASALDIRWLGFSYIAFRLLATLRDRQTGKLPAMTLREYATYLIFFPALTAGPIDRPERFLKDLRLAASFSAAEALAGGQRLAVGLFRKFVLADGLAFFALDPYNAPLIQGTGWLWLAVMAYSLRIYFDFSGYTDIAIGLARWLGIQLPENFNRPYLKPNLTQFWNNWHMTLTQWFRAYYFNPLTRLLRSRKPALPPAWIIFITQLTTMVLIGLWHGMTLNFTLWGLWHGIGLFVHNRYAEISRPWLARLQQKPALHWGYTLISTAFSFAFISLGWVWFVLPQPAMALDVLRRLFGI